MKLNNRTEEQLEAVKLCKSWNPKEISTQSVHHNPALVAQVKCEVSEPLSTITPNTADVETKSTTDTYPRMEEVVPSSEAVISPEQLEAAEIFFSD